MALSGRDIGREMLLEYEWNNSAAEAAAMLLFGEQSAAQETVTHERHAFEHYGHGAGAAVGFMAAPQMVPQQMTAAALFSASPSCHQAYGLALPPAAPALGRIGLNLGVRTYFSSEEGMGMGPVVGRTSRRRGRTARCQAEGCGADLTHAKHYHRRHKVCEFHSKASIVLAAGLSQRFCQQCSRFHVLSEFDQGKRSCRKRLADHNRRRRKSQDLSMTTAAANTANEDNNNGEAKAVVKPNPDKILFTASTSNNSNRLGCNLEPSSTVIHLSTPTTQPPMPPAPTPQMALGLGCYSQTGHEVNGGVAVVPASTGLSASSSTGTSPTSPSFLPHLGDLRAHEHRFHSWEEGEDGSSLRGLFQNK